MSSARILLHICCGNCAIYPVQELGNQGFKVIGLFYNPNIQPLQEYLARRNGVEQVAEKLGIRVIFLDQEHRPADFLQNVVFRENHRCQICYHLRLGKALSVAKRGEFEYFSTTLLHSKMQNHDQIRDTGYELSVKSKVSFFYQDFRTGWREAIEKSQEWGIYRQNYCGCIYSEFERFQNELKKLY